MNIHCISFPFKDMVKISSEESEVSEEDDLPEIVVPRRRR